PTLSRRLRPPASPHYTPLLRSHPAPPRRRRARPVGLPGPELGGDGARARLLRARRGTLGRAPPRGARHRPPGLKDAAPLPSAAGAGCRRAGAVRAGSAGATADREDAPEREDDAAPAVGIGLAQPGAELYGEMFAQRLGQCLERGPRT